MNTAIMGSAAGSAPPEQDSFELQEGPQPRTRADFLVLAAQELRNPLHALSLQIDAARQTARHLGDTALLAPLGKAQELMARYTRRAELLLELIRAGEQHYPLQSRPCDLAVLAQSCAYALRGDAAHHGAQLRVDTPQSLSVYTDGFAVEQIILQLLGNAIRHAGATLITLRLQQTCKAALLRVIDNGCGLPPGFEQDRLQRFARGPGTDRDPTQRHPGLGLWSVYELASIIGATIEAEGARDEGASFTLCIPSSQPQ